MIGNRKYSEILVIGIILKYEYLVELYDLFEHSGFLTTAKRRIERRRSLFRIKSAQIALRLKIRSSIFFCSYSILSLIKQFLHICNHLRNVDHAETHSTLFKNISLQSRRAFRNSKPRPISIN